VDKLLESPVVRLAELIHRILDIHILTGIVHYREHHLDLNRLVTQVLQKYAQEVLAVGACAIRVENQPPIRWLLIPAHACLILRRNATWLKRPATAKMTISRRIVRIKAGRDGRGAGRRAW